MILARIVMCFLAVGSFTAPLQAGWLDNVTNYFRKTAPEAPPTIKVLVVHDKPGVVLEVKGKYKIFNPHTGEHMSTRFIGKRKFIQAINDGIKWGEEFPGVHQLMILPDDKGTTTIVDGIEYPGQIFVYDIGGTISIVNYLGIEDYINSVLSQNFRQPMPEEALAAVAIAARTAAYYRVENPKSQYWDIDGQQTGYQGYAPMTLGNPVQGAVKATRYMVMSRSGKGEQQIIPFLAVWKGDGQVFVENAVNSQISLADVDGMAKGDHAAQILEKAFPGAKIELIHYAETPAKK